jgi:hypothetical protein
MTKKLSELFNLPGQESIPETTVDAQTALELTQVQQQTLDLVDEAIDKIDAALPGVRGLDSSDQELDDLAELAKKSAQDLMDLGLAMEARFSGAVLQTAGTMLGHAITAKQAKIDKKLRTIDLQLKKMRLDHQISKDTKGENGEEPIETQGQLVDRNTLLAEILKGSK